MRRPPEGVVGVESTVRLEKKGVVPAAAALGVAACSAGASGSGSMASRLVVGLVALAAAAAHLAAQMERGAGTGISPPGPAARDVPDK